MAHELGETKQVFRPRMDNLIAGIILGLGLIIGGVFLANYFAEKHFANPRETVDYIGRYAIYAILGLGGPIGGVTLIYRMILLVSHQVTIWDNGFSYKYGNKNETCLWSQLQKIYEIFTEEELKILKVPGAKLKNLDRRFCLVRSDGKTFEVNVNSINDISKFGEYLEEARDKNGIPWEQIQG